MRRHMMSWHELRRAEKSWEELWKLKESWDEMGWPDGRRLVKSWVETSCVEWRSWEELKREEFRCAEKRWEKLRRRRMEKLRRAEPGREDMRWDGMRWDEVKKTEKTWDELRWDGMTQTAVTMGCSEQFPNEAAMRWEMKWGKIQHSKDTAPDWQVKSLLLRCTGGLPVTYRHSLCSALWAISVSILKLPPPACPGTNWIDR